MSRAASITWVAATDSTTAVVNNYSHTGNVNAFFTFTTSSNVTGFPTQSLTSNPIYQGGIGNTSPAGFGTTLNYYTMPDIYNRNLAFLSSQNVPSNTIFIVGLDTNGTVVNETLGAITANTILYSTNYYYKVFNIYCTSIASFIVSVGLGNKGFSSLYITDIWNKNNNYSISISNVTGTVEITPLYSIHSPISYPNGQQTYTATGDVKKYYEFPYDNTNAVTLSPSTAVIPIVEDASISTINIPMNSIILSIDNTTGGFDATILQQGAKF